MRKQLAVDPATREVRLVFTDLWQGEHERTEYRVLDLDGGRVHERHPGEWGHLLGQPVHGQPPPGRYYVHRRGWPDTEFRTEDTAAGPTVKTPCPKATNPRRKCPLCQEATTP
jgi:hypothetical protein